MQSIALARQGAKVIVTDIGLEKECPDFVNEIKGGDGTVLCLEMDVSKKEQVDAAFDAAIKHFGRLDILVNNAGIYFFKARIGTYGRGVG